MLIADPPETGIPNDFVDRQHAVYCKRDLSDLEKLVHHYLREDAEREAITSAGYDHLVKYHTCERRGEEFFAKLRRPVLKQRGGLLQSLFFVRTLFTVAPAGVDRHPTQLVPLLLPRRGS